jgi:hypothetical protein
MVTTRGYIVGPAKPSNPAVAWLLESPCLLAREDSNARTTVPSICTQAAAAASSMNDSSCTENRRAKPINAAAVEAAAPNANAHYYGRDDPIVGMPCGR